MLKVMDIFKFLPAAKKAQYSNCKECGCSTCMMFAMKISKSEITIDKCPQAPQELAEAICEATKVQQREILVDGLKIGGETVMFRHEKTFINPCPFFVRLDALNQDFEKDFKRVKDFQIEILGNTYKVDGILLENAQDTDRARVKDAGFALLEDLSLFLKADEGANVCEMVEGLTRIREKAILERDEAFSAPVTVYFKEEDPLKLCAKASAAVCKYASVLIFDHFDEAVFSALITLRLNIYTDPQKPLQVESKVYEFNIKTDGPDENARVFLTTNFALSYFAVANELSALKDGSYLVVTPSEGMSVLTAWSAQKITAEIASKIVSSDDTLGKVKDKKLIIPGLLGDLKDELSEALDGWEIIVGPNEAYKIPEFISVSR